MAPSSDVRASRASTPTIALVVAYVVVVLGTLLALALLSWAGSSAATSEGWIHAAIVAGLAVILVVRLRAARRGDRRGLIAVGIVALVLLAVNLVEALIPHLFEPWMRIEMVAIAVLMAVLAFSVRRDLRPAVPAA